MLRKAQRMRIIIVGESLFMKSEYFFDLKTGLFTRRDSHVLRRYFPSVSEIVLSQEKEPQESLLTEECEVTIAPRRSFWTIFDGGGIGLVPGVYRLDGQQCRFAIRMIMDDARREADKFDEPEATTVELPPVKKDKTPFFLWKFRRMLDRLRSAVVAFCVKRNHSVQRPSEAYWQPVVSMHWPVPPPVRKLLTDAFWIGHFPCREAN